MQAPQINMQAVEQYLERAQQYSKENPLIVGASAVVGLLGLRMLFTPKRSMKRDGKDFESASGVLKLLSNQQTTMGDTTQGSVDKNITQYLDQYQGARTGATTTDESIKARAAQYDLVVNSFYNVVTDFYEWGWGQSFHFAPRWKSETFRESIKRAEYLLCARLKIAEMPKEGQAPLKVLDVGCGVGGPMRNMCIFANPFPGRITAKFTGVTLNAYQVKVGNEYCQNMGLSDRARLTQGDFQSLPEYMKEERGTFDAAFAIEATCHSPDRVRVFTGIATMLRQGGRFAGYEWVMLKDYDPTNKEHVRIKEGIEHGNGLPTLTTADKVVEALEASGFTVVDHYDANNGQHSEHQIPWYDGLNGKYSLEGFRMTRLGRVVTHSVVTILELLRIAPRGSIDVSAMLNATADDLVLGGQYQIFTPSYFFVAQKK